MVLKKKSANTIEKITRSLEQNNVVIIPCDTIYGFAALPGVGEEKIRKIKGRDENKSFISLAPSSEKVLEIASCFLDKKLLSLWPGPLTLIVKTASGGTSALRVPSDRFLLTLLQKLNSLIVSTSVNLSGMPSLNIIDDIIKQFESSVDFIVDGGDIESSLPSTIVDATSLPYKIVRQGGLVVPPEYLGQ